MSDRAFLERKPVGEGLRVRPAFQKCRGKGRAHRSVLLLGPGASGHSFLKYAVGHSYECPPLTDRRNTGIINI